MPRATADPRRARAASRPASRSTTSCSSSAIRRFDPARPRVTGHPCAGNACAEADRLSCQGDGAIVGGLRARVRSGQPAQASREHTDHGMETVRDYLRKVLDQAFAAARIVSALVPCHAEPGLADGGILLNLVSAALIVDGQLRWPGSSICWRAASICSTACWRGWPRWRARFGAFLDSTADRISEGVVFAAIAYHFARHGLPVDAALDRAGAARLAAGELHPGPRRRPGAGVQGRHRHPRRARGADRARA